MLLEPGRERVGAAVGQQVDDASAHQVAQDGAPRSSRGEHSVLIEQTHSALAEARYPACIAGKRNCPPEDCGGPAGYQELLAILADPTHPEHTEWVEWIGGDFDPEAFAVEAADAAVAARFS